MNLNFGINPPQSRDEETLYRLAYQCVASHATVHCNQCTTCTYNVDRYGWDPTQVDLIRARALVDYQQGIVSHKAKKKEYFKTELTIVGMVAILCLILFIGVKIIEAQ